MKIFTFFIQGNSSPHEFLITRYNCFSVNHVNADIKNNVEKDSTLLAVFLSKSPGGHAISRQKHFELPVVSYLLIKLFYIGMPVVRTEGQLYRHVITKISPMDGLPNFLLYGAPLARGAPL